MERQREITLGYSSHHHHTKPAWFVVLLNLMTWISMLFFFSLNVFTALPHVYWTLIRQQMNHPAGSAQITAQHYKSDASAVGLNKSQKHVYVVVCVSISNGEAVKFSLLFAQRACAPLLSHVVWTAINLSESYSWPTLNEAHLQGTDSSFPVPVRGPHTPMHLREAHL